jgi:two-component system CheB/CheR fusion protein
MAVPWPAHADDGARTQSDAELRVNALTQELRAKDDYLQTTTEELETSNEELRSSNEEMQSINEELQSTNEELETSKEELQSVNEELATVNAELQAKVLDLSRANNDMNNLLAGTGVATVFVDHSLRILRFTPAATQIINLISNDIGRPVGHIVSNLRGYDGIVADTLAVLDTLIPKEIEVQTKAGAWYTMRILPYRTLENVIEGAVLTFVDITHIKVTQAQQGESEAKFRALFSHTDTAMVLLEPVLDASSTLCDYVFVDANPAFARVSGLRLADVLGQRATQVIQSAQRARFFECCAELRRTMQPLPIAWPKASTTRISDATAIRIRQNLVAVLFVERCLDQASSASGQVPCRTGDNPTESRKNRG